MCHCMFFVRKLSMEFGGHVVQRETVNFAQRCGGMYSVLGYTYIYVRPRSSDRGAKTVTVQGYSSAIQGAHGTSIFRGKIGFCVSFVLRCLDTCLVRHEVLELVCERLGTCQRVVFLVVL